MDPKVLKVAYLIDGPLHQIALDPAKVETVRQANLVRALYSRLVEFDVDGSLVPSLSESFDIEENKIHFTISPRVKTLSGNWITAKDVGLTLKRLLILKSNRHSSLSSFLCGHSINHIDDACEGISWEGERLTLIIRNSSTAKFLLSTLASVDFSVIPAESVDWAKPGMPIVDYQNTSGVYFVDADFNGISINLKKNSTHYYSSRDNADIIELVKADFSEALKLFELGKVDFVPTIYQFSEDFVKKAEEKGAFLHKTLPVRIWFLHNFSDTFERFSKAEITYINSIIKQKLPVKDFDFGFEKSEELFPTNGEAELGEMEKKTIRLIWESVPEAKIQKKYRVWVPVTKLETLKEVYKNIPFIEFYNDSKYPWSLSKKDQPDAMIIAMDSTFFEDVSVVSYNFNMGFFGYSKNDAEKWLENYFETKSREKRIFQLKKLHFEVLEKLVVVPLGFTPYVGVSQNGWKIDFSKYYAGSPLWRLKK